MPKTHIKHCKRPQFNKIYHFESFYYGSRIKKVWFQGVKITFLSYKTQFDVKASSFNAIFSPIIVVYHCGSRKHFILHLQVFRG